MISISDIKKKAENLYPDYLASKVVEQVFFPKVMPSDKSVSNNFVEMKKELSELIEYSKDRKGFGYSISYKQVMTRKHGLQDLPESIGFETDSDFLKFLRKETEVKTFLLNSKIILSVFPILQTWIAKYPLKIIQFSENWKPLLAVCQYFSQHHQPNLYLRELPVPVHSKFIEQHKGILNELLTVILPESSINGEYLGAKDFEKRFGLKYMQSLIRIRILDNTLSVKYLSGLTDIQITENEFINWQIPCKNVLIVENKTNYANIMNFLTLPQLTQSIGIFGSGFKIANLQKATWLSTKNIYYWGDIDVQGLQILSQMRGYFPQTQAIMMDFATLEAFKMECGEGTPTNVSHLSHLTAEEQALFMHLKTHNLRLEQEKIRQEYVLEQLEKWE